MKCVICKHGETKESVTTVTLEKSGTTLIFKNVPASVCVNCGETYVPEKTTERLMQSAQNAIREGVSVDIREFKAA